MQGEDFEDSKMYGIPVKQQHYKKVILSNRMQPTQKQKRCVEACAWK